VLVKRYDFQEPQEQSGEIQEVTTETIPVNWERRKFFTIRDGVICLKVSGFNRGGLLVCGDGLQGFVPVSHLVKMTGQNEADDQEKWLAAYVGQQLQLKVIECDPERGRVVFSERAALAEPGSRKTLMEHLLPGDCTRVQ